MFHKITQLTRTSDMPKRSDRQNRIYTFLQEMKVGVLSTVTPDGNPHGVVIYFTVNPDFSISFLTKAGTRKYDNIMHDNHVMLTVFEPRTQATTQITGQAYPMQDSKKIHDLTETVLGVSQKSSEAGVPPITKLQVGNYAAFTITPLQIRMAVYDRPDSGSYGELFESIESFELNTDK